MWISRYEFVPDKVRGIDAFKIPELTICPIFYSEHAVRVISEVLGDDLQFKLLWSDEERVEQSTEVREGHERSRSTQGERSSHGPSRFGKSGLSQLFGFIDKKKGEDQMAEWLSHPSEFGVAPKFVRYRKTEKAKLVTYGKVRIHVVDYEMPNGKKGRGFVNDSLTWSFLGDDVNAISDDDHFTAYCGWAWLFPALQGDTVKTDFVSQRDEVAFSDSRRRSGIKDFRITGRYQIGTSELFEYDGSRGGVKVKGAGGTENLVEFPASDARHGLPAIYFLLGEEVILSR